MTFTENEEIQYKRHLILSELGPEGQKKLKKSSVLIIGAGGLGCPVLQYLTAAGIGKIGIIDDDVVDQTNLQRQILYTHDDIGKSKVSAAIKRLSALNPYITFKGYPEKLMKENAVEYFKQYDIIVDGSDNFPTRYLVNDAAVLANKPLVFGSIYKFEGQVSVFNYQDGPTYRCLFPQPPKPNEVPSCSEIGVLGILPGIIGCFQANEVIKLVTGLGSVLSGQLLTYNVLNHSQFVLKFQKDPNINIVALEKDYDYFCGIPTNIIEMQYSEIKDKTEQYFLIDVREEWERLEGHIGGVHIPVHELPARFNEIQTDLPIVVYCQSGNRGKTAVMVLEEKLPNHTIHNLEGGYSGIV